MKHKVLNNVLTSCHSMLSCHKKHVLNNSGKHVAGAMTCIQIAGTSRKCKSQVQVASASHRYKSDRYKSQAACQCMCREDHTHAFQKHAFCFVFCFAKSSSGAFTLRLCCCATHRAIKRLASLKTTLPEWWPKIFLAVKHQPIHKYTPSKSRSDLVQLINRHALPDVRHQLA